MKCKKAILASLLAFSSFSASAEFISGNKLFSLITSEKTTEKAFAYGYVAGVFDVGHGVLHCAPDNVTVQQIVDITIKALQSAPEYRDRSADQFVNASVNRIWPCKKQPSQSKGSPV